MILFRPVGLNELELIAQSEYKCFPPRLPEQPIFYPVITETYARQIAEDWNTKTSPFAGFVLKFEVDDEFIAKYEIHTVGNRSHQEIWIPADELEKLNQKIIGKIEITAAYYGKEFNDEIDKASKLPKNITDIGKV